MVKLQWPWDLSISWITTPIQSAYYKHSLKKRAWLLMMYSIYYYLNWLRMQSPPEYIQYCWVLLLHYFCQYITIPIVLQRVETVYSMISNTEVNEHFIPSYIYSSLPLYYLCLWLHLHVMELWFAAFAGLRFTVTTISLSQCYTTQMHTIFDYAETALAVHCIWFIIKNLFYCNVIISIIILMMLNFLI